MTNPQKIQYLVIDLFCGFGGTTLGFESARINGQKIAKVIACVNHDPKAIKSHWLNHPEVQHYEEDIRTLDLSGLVKTLEHWKNTYPQAAVILWASLECTNFSKAKGGLPRDADSRTLAMDLFRYQKALNPDYVMIENVVEFMSWGPLDSNGKPVSKRKGTDWIQWCNTMCSFGYNHDWRELNSANYGAFTSRNRLFGCFAKNGMPIHWPEPTHAKRTEPGLFQNLEKWQPVRQVLDFNDEGESIFNRKKALSDRTLERIFAGLIKFVAKGDKSFITKYYSGRPMGKVTSTEVPLGTITTVANQALAQCHFLLKYNSINGKTGVHHPPSVEEPAPVVSTQGRLGIIKTQFLQHYYGNGFNTSTQEPCPTLRTKDSAGLIEANYFIHREFKTATHSSINEPAGTITTVPKMNLVETCKFLMNPQFNNAGSSLEKPCFTLIAKMDKKPPYLVEIEKGQIAIAVYDTDSETMIKIKAFMAAYGIIDIKMRMLRIKELLKIQGFPEDYKMQGTQADAKKFIGNSVVPVITKHWIMAFAR